MFNGSESLPSAVYTPYVCAAGAAMRKTPTQRSAAGKANDGTSITPPMYRFHRRTGVSEKFLRNISESV